MAITIGKLLKGLTANLDSLNTTVDKLNFGNMDTEVKGVVTTFSASQYVIERAVALGANLIITHEGLFFSHHELQDELKKDPVYVEKNRLIENSGIGIYRFHDYLHRYKPDGIMEGLLHALDWQEYVEEQQPAAAILKFPAMEVTEVAEYLKRKLHISYVRVAGEPSMLCRRVGILVGYRGGGSSAIPLFENSSLDLIIAGEGPEWETPEYVRDAVHQGRNKALIMLGHAESEVPGMKYLADQLSAQYPMLPVHFVEDQPIFKIL